MRIRVNPTRMQLLLLKKRLELAKRGHKLLKDKLDGLVVEFLSAKKNFINDYEALTVPLREVFRKAIVGSALTTPQNRKSFDFEKSDLEIAVINKNIMGTNIKEYSLSFTDRPIAFLSGRSALFYQSAIEFKNILPKLVELASRFNALKILSKQIYETRRRVNALEYVLIPELTKTAKSIRFKLEENERSSRTVLIKMEEIDKK